MIIDIHANANAMEVLAQQISSMPIIGRLFSHHTLVDHRHYIPGNIISRDRPPLSDVLTHGLPLHSLVTYTCPQVWLIGALMHQPAPCRHHKIMLARAPFQPRLPRQWGKTVLGAVLVNLLEQPLRELLCFSRPLCLSASGCCYRSPQTNCNTGQTCTCSKLQ